jgi:large subunit ribosomal protein L23
MDKQILLKPRMSEKAYALSQSSGVYVFIVPKNANKLTVGKAVAAQFDVTVEDVRIAHLPPKAKRTMYKGGRRSANGVQPGIKKAYVQIKDGDSIPIFAAEDEERARTEKLQQQLAKGKGKK